MNYPPNDDNQSQFPPPQQPDTSYVVARELQKRLRYIPLRQPFCGWTSMGSPIAGGSNPQHLFAHSHLSRSLQHR